MNVRAHGRRLLLPLSLAAAVAGLGVTAPAMGQNAAVVNGKAISQKKVDEFVDQLKAQGRPDSPDLRKAVREELIARELFVQEADRQGLAKTSDVQRQLEAARQDILIRAVIRESLRKSPITDQQVRAEYDRVKAQNNGEKEYKARHILVENEDQAKTIIADLKKGSKFEDLAKQSKDTGSAANGGDLDWNPASTFVKEFGDALTGLKKGELTQTPVKTQYGYHVIRLDDVRDVQPPPYEQVKPQIQQELERRRVQQLQQDLRAKAKVE